MPGFRFKCGGYITNFKISKLEGANIIQNIITRSSQQICVALRVAKLLVGKLYR